MFLAIAARRVLLLATFYFADGAPVDALAFWSEAAVSTNLLIMAWAIAGRAGLLITILSLAQWPPFSVGNFVLLDRYSLSSCVSKSKGRASVLVPTWNIDCAVVRQRRFAAGRLVALEATYVFEPLPTMLQNLRSCNFL